MPEFDKNAAYIWACYLVAVVLIGGTCLQAWLAARKTKRQLAALTANDERADS